MGQPNCGWGGGTPPAVKEVTQGRTKEIEEVYLIQGKGEQEGQRRKDCVPAGSGGVCN